MLLCKKKLFNFFLAIPKEKKKKKKKRLIFSDRKFNYLSKKVKIGIMSHRQEKRVLNSSMPLLFSI